MDKPREWILSSHNLIHKVEGPAYQSTDRIRVIEFSAYKKLEDEFKLVRDIGVEMQRECNRKLSLENKKLEERLKVAINKFEKIEKDFIPSHQREEGIALSEIRQCASEALAAIRDEGK